MNYRGETNLGLSAEILVHINNMCHIYTHSRTLPYLKASIQMAAMGGMGDFFIF